MVFGTNAMEGMRFSWPLGGGQQAWGDLNLHLCEATIHKQFRSRDVAAVVGGEKHHGLRDLIGCTEPAEWNSVGNHLLALLARFCGGQQLTQSGRIGGAWAHCVHANAAIL